MNFDDLKVDAKKEFKTNDESEVLIEYIEKCEKIHEEKLKLHCKDLVHEEVLKEYYIKIQDVKDAIDKATDKLADGKSWINKYVFEQELFGTKEVGE